MSTPITIDQLSKYILEVLEDVTKDFPPEEKGEAQANILAAWGNGRVVKKKESNEPHRPTS
jgi:hypothetical protein